MKTDMFLSFSAAILFAQLVVFVSSMLGDPINIVLIGIVLIGCLILLIKPWEVINNGKKKD